MAYTQRLTYGLENLWSCRSLETCDVPHADGLRLRKNRNAYPGSDVKILFSLALIPWSPCLPKRYLAPIVLSEVIYCWPVAHLKANTFISVVSFVETIRFLKRSNLIHVLRLLNHSSLSEGLRAQTRVSFVNICLKGRKSQIRHV